MLFRSRQISEERSQGRLSVARNRLWFTVALASLLSVVAGGCAGGGGDPAVIKIVSSMPRTGSAKEQTDSIANGIRIALEEAQHRAGPFELVYADCDDATTAAGQWTAEKETANAKRAARDPDVMVYIGTYNSGAAKISMPILNRAHLLMISPANTAIGLTKPGLGDRGEPEMYRPSGKLNYVRVVPADDLQGSLSAAWAKEMGFQRVWVLDDNEMYGKGLATAFADACRDLGIEVLGEESIDAKAQEFRSLMIAVREARPDLIYFGGSTQTKGGQIAKDLVAAGIDARFMAPDACFEDAFIASAGPENVNDRCFVTFGGLPPDALTGRAKEFADRYEARFHKPPAAYAIYGYEAAKVAIAAIERAGVKNRQAIVDACLSIKDFDQGALGRWSFDANGDTTIKSISGSTVHNGKFQFVKVLGDEKPDAAFETTARSRNLLTARRSSFARVPLALPVREIGDDSIAIGASGNWANLVERIAR
jgi:branched-chain amino acid transport system substrate-binding protein